LKIVHEHTAVEKGASAHRGGGVHFLSLLQGEENTSGNFHLTLVYANDYVAPRHRHNFDQVRIVLDGAFGFDHGMVQEAGMLGYFTEGNYYTQKSVGKSMTLLLQAGGASGTGYMSDNQLRSAVENLQSKGQFNSGVFTWLDSTGKKHNQDGYEAAWEFVRNKIRSHFLSNLFYGEAIDLLGSQLIKRALKLDDLLNLQTSNFVWLKSKLRLERNVISVQKTEKHCFTVLMARPG
jgi:hypothetical protein